MYSLCIFPISGIYTLILQLHARLTPISELLLLSLPIKFVFAYHVSHACYMKGITYNRWADNNVDPNCRRDVFPSYWLKGIPHSQHCIKHTDGCRYALFSSLRIDNQFIKTNFRKESRLKILCTRNCSNLIRNNSYLLLCIDAHMLLKQIFILN